jgi:hypothetical protein
VWSRLKGTLPMSRTIKWLLLTFILTALFGTEARAQTINAATCNSSDVQAALNSVAADGTTVIIPAGTCAWSMAVTYNKAFSTTIRGQSSIATTNAQGNPATFNDSTLITDNHKANSALFTLTTTAGKIYRMTGISFASGTNGTVDNGVIQINGSSQSVRVDHCHFNGLNQIQVQVTAVYGVFDHDLFNPSTIGIRQLGSGNGDAAWNTSTQLGSNQYIYVENSTFGNGGVASNDCLTGGNFVFRFNSLTGASSTSSNNNGGQLQTHPTGHTQSDDRGCRKWEIYKNTYAGGAQGFDLFNGMFASAGTGVMWGNTFGPHFSHVITFHNMRRNNTTYSQNAQPGGWGYCGTSFNGTGSSWDQNSVVNTGYACLDQIGRGGGDLLSGNGAAKVNVALGGQTWPRQPLEPVYEWMDAWTNDGSSNNSYFGVQDGGITQNQDFYGWCDPTSNSGCTSFNGTVGVGSGTLAARPATCTTGVGYWATDQGNWNVSSSGGDGQLYKCTVTNTWALYYTPYTYPHPLTQGSGTPPAPPTALAEVVN